MREEELFSYSRISALVRQKFPNCNSLSNFSENDITGRRTELIREVYLQMMLEFGFSSDYFTTSLHMLEEEAMYNEMIPYMKIVMGIKYLLDKIGHMDYDFYLTDLLNPNPKRTQLFFTFLLNFHNFCEEIFKDIKEAEDNVTMFEVKRNKLKEAMDRYRSERNQLLIRQEDCPNSEALQQNIYKLEKAIDGHRKEAELLNAQIHELEEQQEKELAAKSEKEEKVVRIEKNFEKMESSAQLKDELDKSNEILSSCRQKIHELGMVFANAKKVESLYNEIKALVENLSENIIKLRKQQEEQKMLEEESKRIAMDETIVDKDILAREKENAELEIYDNKLRASKSRKQQCEKEELQNLQEEVNRVKGKMSDHLKDLNSKLSDLQTNLQSINRGIKDDDTATKMKAQEIEDASRSVIEDMKLMYRQIRSALAQDV